MQVDRQVLVEAEAVCVAAAREAGDVLKTYFRAPLDVEFKEKGEQSPVTEADRRSEAGHCIARLVHVLKRDPQVQGDRLRECTDGQ